MLGSAENQVGYLIKTSSATAGTVQVSGDNNLGIFAENTTLTTGNITVGNSSSENKASVGVYISGNATVGTVTVGKNSIGVFGKSGNITAADITANEGSVGIYGKGSGNHTELISTTGPITVGEKETLGIYGLDIDINVSASSVTIGKGTSVALVSEGVGNVIYNGNTIVADKGTSSGSIVLYKKGVGNITTSGNWTIGKSGYGLFLLGNDPGKIGGIVAINAASINLAESAVGIFADASKGAITVRNTGVINTGATWLGPSGSHLDIENHENSVGIYLTGGAKGYNSGTLIADEDHSVGVYALGTGTYFENTGTITVSGGSTGIFLKGGANAVNKGTITLLDGSSACGAYTIGVAVYQGAKFVNETVGVINAGDGIGVYVAED